MKKHVPNLVTSLNLAAGFFSIILASSGDVITASWLILAAMIFDFFDGFAARLLHSWSDIGKELDSLADVVSFGVAPAFVIYRIILGDAEYAPADILYSAAIALMPVCAALRLAKFNIDTTQTTGFKGLPTPANALAVISLIIADHYTGKLGFILNSPAIMLLIAIVLSLLMVTRIPLLSLKTKHLRWKGNEGRYVIIAVSLVAFLILGIAAAPLIIPVYIIVSLAIKG
jgi:CDP-diacylglycerol--serine O-phosphatidyltransferase